MHLKAFIIAALKRISLYYCILTIMHTDTFTTEQHYAQTLHSYMWANYLTFSGELKKAHDWHTLTTSLCTSHHSYKGYIYHLFKSKQYDPIIAIINKFSIEFAQDESIQKLFAISLAQTGKTQESDSLFIRLHNKFKDNQEIAFHAINSYLRVKEPENALLAIDSLIQNSDKNQSLFLFHFLKAYIYQSLHDHKNALNQIEKSLELNPGFDKGWLLFALINEQSGIIEKAIKGYSNFLLFTKEPTNDIQKKLLDLILKEKNNKNATLYRYDYSLHLITQLYQNIKHQFSYIFSFPIAKILLSYNTKKSYVLL